MPKFTKKYLNKKDDKILEKRKAQKDFDVRADVDQLKVQMSKVWNALNIKN